MIVVSLKTENRADNKLTDGKGEDSALNRIELSDGSLFSFRICYLPPEVKSGAITEGSVITAAQEEGFRFASACLRAEKAALRLIARAEQCTEGLSRKLTRKNHETVCVDAVTGRLSALNLINDRRFAQLWIESRLRLSRSPRRLLSSLCARGIDRKDAQTALKASLDDDAEFTMLLRYVKKYLRKARQRRKETARSFKYQLKNEGFSLHVISRFLDNEQLVVS
jgi:regulatory protein